jgi:hypothetical protein
MNISFNLSIKMALFSLLTKLPKFNVQLQLGVLNVWNNYKAHCITLG